MRRINKILISVLSIVVFATCTVCFVACDNHNEGNDQITLTREELSAAFKDSANAAFTLLGFDNSNTKNVAKSMTSYNLPVVGDKVDESGTDIKHLKANAISSVALINMIGDLYANKNFVVTNKAVSFEVNYNNNTAKLTILPKVDKIENKVEMEISLELSGSLMYYCFELDYDFETEILSSFSIHIVFPGDISDGYQCQRMDGDEFYMTTNPPQNYVDALAGIKNEFLAKKQDAVNLTANFQTEFDAYMAISQKAFTDASK